MLMKFSENAELLVRMRLESDKIKYVDDVFQETF